MTELYGLAGELGMQSLVEVYEPENVDRVLRLDPPFMGVNNRNLRTFVTDLGHTVNLRQRIPTDVLLVGESGIHTPEDVSRLQEAGVHAILVGESLMRQEDIGAAVRTLLRIEGERRMRVSLPIAQEVVKMFFILPGTGRIEGGAAFSGSPRGEPGCGLRCPSIATNNVN